MPVTGPWAYLTPILLLISSNVFMTLAWYGHLNFKEKPLLLVIFAAWGIAFVEYCLAVPANRYGHAVYSAAELKTIQEVITLVVFAGFSMLYRKEPAGVEPRRRLRPDRGGGGLRVLRPRVRLSDAVRSARTRLQATMASQYS